MNTRLLLVLLVALIATVAVACGGDDDDDDDDGGAAQAAPAIPTQLPTTIPPAVSTTAPVAKAAPATEPKTEPVAVAEGKPQYGGNLRVSITEYPPKFDVTQTSTWIALALFGRSYNGLLQYSPRDGVEIWPSMATGWEVSSDGLTYTFDIDPRITEWNDGQPFDVNDIIFAYNRWVNPPEGIIQPRQGGLDFASLEKVDATTLAIHLDAPSAVMVPEAANGWHVILPKHILEANDNALPEFDLVIGTGPYLITDAEQGISATTKRNPNYFRSDPDGNPYPYLDNMTVIAIPVGESAAAAARTKRIDVARLPLGGILALKEIAGGFSGNESSAGESTMSVVAMTDIASIQMNNREPPFDDINARKAILYGVDRTVLFEFHGEEAPVFPATWYSNLVFGQDEITSIMPGHDPSKRAEEIRLAKEFAAKAGLTSFELIGVTPVRIKDAEIIAETFSTEIGIDVTIRQQDWAGMVAACEGRKFEAATGGTAPSYAGVLSIIGLMWAEGGGRNCGWDVTEPAEWTALWDQVKVMPASPERDRLLREMHDIQMNDWTPSIPYYGIGSSKFWYNYVRNINNIAQEIFSNNLFEDVWLDEDAPGR